MTYTTSSYPVGATVQYDPTGQHSPTAPKAGITNNTSGGAPYTLVTRDPHTGRPQFPPIYNVPQEHVYRTDPVPGPGNDL